MKTPCAARIRLHSNRGWDLSQIDSLGATPLHELRGTTHTTLGFELGSARGV